MAFITFLLKMWVKKCIKMVKNKIKMVTLWFKMQKTETLLLGGFTVQCNT